MFTSNNQFGRRMSSRLVLFGSKGRADNKKAANTSVGVSTRKRAVADARENTNVVIDQQKTAYFATLASWYAEKRKVEDIENEWNTFRKYDEKQRNLRFLAL
jgi:hypothetical protein